MWPRSTFFNNFSSSSNQWKVKAAWGMATELTTDSGESFSEFETSIISSGTSKYDQSSRVDGKKSIGHFRFGFSLAGFACSSFLEPPLGLFARSFSSAALALATSLATGTLVSIITRNNR